MVDEAAQEAQFPNLCIKSFSKCILQKKWPILEHIFEYVSIMAMTENTNEEDQQDFAELTNEEKLVTLQEAVVIYQHKMQELQEERDSYLQALRRNQADFENFKKRSIKDRDIAVVASTRKMVEQLVPILDNIDYAIDALDTEAEIFKPVKMISDAFNKVLVEHKVSRIDPQIGEPFDPEVHQAISVLPADVNTQIVGHVARPGYMIDGKVFRPSDVVVQKPR